MKKNYSLILRKIIFAFNSISVIGIAIFILYTTRKICDAYVASDFLEKVNAIPANPSALVGEILVLVAIMGISFICREKFVRENTGVYYLTLLIDFCASFFIVYRLDFNYNGILLWVFANLIAHIKDMGGKYVLAVISLLSYIGTNHGIISVSTKIFSVNDYIKVYDIGIQKVLYWLYNLLTSLNIILFFVFCVFIIIEQSGTIDEVKKLYFKLSQTNEELQQANEKLQEYAVMKEKMGETKERNRLAREIHDTLGLIFRKQILNDNLFGKLTIFPTGEVYSNVNFPTIGNIQDQKLSEIVYSEIENYFKPWFFTRDYVSCKNCVNKYLCPSISNYEIVANEYNMCYLNQ